MIYVANRTKMPLAVTIKETSTGNTSTISLMPKPARVHLADGWDVDSVWLSHNPNQVNVFKV